MGHAQPRHYRRREPERSALYTTLQDHLATFLADANTRGDGFHPLPAPSNDDVRAVLEEIACRLPRVPQKHGIDQPDAIDRCAADTPLLAACYAGSVMQRAAFGPREGRRPPRIGANLEGEWTDRRRNCHAELDGFDLHAAVRVAAHARDRVEQLLRYCARPAISHNRLETVPDGRLRLALKTPWHDGTTHVLLSRDELLQRLVALIPRPEKNLLVYQGVLAPNAKWRKRVAWYERPAPNNQPSAHGAEHHETVTPKAPCRPNQDWARLMQRAFDIDVLNCPRCGDRMRLIALVQSETAAGRILRHLGLRDHAPPQAPARTPAFDFDDVA